MPTDNKRIKVYLIEDEKLVRENLKKILSADPNYTYDFIGEAGVAEFAIHFILDHWYEIDLILLDLVLVTRDSGADPSAGAAILEAILKQLKKTGEQKPFAINIISAHVEGDLQTDFRKNIPFHLKDLVDGIVKKGGWNDKERITRANEKANEEQKQRKSNLFAQEFQDLVSSGWKCLPVTVEYMEFSRFRKNSHEYIDLETSKFTYLIRPQHIAMIKAASDSAYTCFHLTSVGKKSLPLGSLKMEGFKNVCNGDYGWLSLDAQKVAKEIYSSYKDLNKLDEESELLIEEGAKNYYNSTEFQSLPEHLQRRKVKNNVKTKYLSNEKKDRLADLSKINERNNALLLEKLFHLQQNWSFSCPFVRVTGYLDHWLRILKNRGCKQFLRIGKSAVINADFWTGFERNAFTLNDGMGQEFKESTPLVWTGKNGIASLFDPEYYSDELQEE